MIEPSQLTPTRAGVAPQGRTAAYLAELIGTFGLVLFIVLVLTNTAMCGTPFGLRVVVVGAAAATAPSHRKLRSAPRAAGNLEDTWAQSARPRSG